MKNKECSYVYLVIGVIGFFFKIIVDNLGKGVSIFSTFLQTELESDTCLHKQDRQCKYNVTLRPVRATIVALEKK